MNDSDNDTSFDAALRRQLQHDDEPADAGFSLRVMQALPAHVPPQQRRRARWVRQTQWLAITVAACGTAGLVAAGQGSLDGPHAMAAAALAGLLIFWSIPSRWSRG